MMASFWSNQNGISINITSTEEISTITYYNIIINIGNVQWKVLHRYSEFYDLHNELVINHGVPKEMLPKKVIRNKCPIFIESRRDALEIYLQNILIYLKRTMPRNFSEFLHLHIYDIYFLLKNLAAHLFVEADNILSTNNFFRFNPLQLHAISECFKTPLPEMHESDTRYDLCHVLDFCSQLQKLILTGKDTEYLKSNIIPNKLPFDLFAFKVLDSLETTDFNMESISSFGNIRNTLKFLKVCKANSQTVAHILQCDILHKLNLDNNQVWSNLGTLDLSNNNIMEIDESIKLVPNVEVLVLNDNKISNLPDLSFLSKLKHLHLSHNLLVKCEKLCLKLGNLSTLDLSQNYITTLDGFAKLYSLETLDLSCNKILQLDSIAQISDLPCLESLVLTGNEVATTVDYRIKTLEFFGENAVNISLDNEKPSQAEIDKVAILRALRIVKEGKRPDLAHNFKL